MTGHDFWPSCQSLGSCTPSYIPGGSGNWKVEDAINSEIDKIILPHGRGLSPVDVRRLVRAATVRGQLQRKSCPVNTQPIQLPCSATRLAPPGSAQTHRLRAFGTLLGEFTII